MTGTNFEETFKQLKMEFTDKLDDRRGEIRDGWAALKDAKGQSAQQEAAQTVQLPIHYLVGAGATFGYDALSEIARPLDVWLRDIIRAKEQVTDENLPAMTAQLDTLLHAMEDAAANPQS